MNSWQQKEAAQATLAKEVGYIRKPHTDRLRVALAFPNTYWVGMSNLGFQTVYQLFNAHDDVVCERIFLPPKQQLKEQLASKTPLITLESQSLARDFDVIAFSVSFEWDYTNILTMLRLAGVPVRASDRTARDPLVVIGGAVTFVNPEPLAMFADVIAAGEGEELVPDLMSSFREEGGRARSAEVAREEARVLHPVVLRRRIHSRRHHRAIRSEGRHGRAPGGEKSRGPDDRSARSAMHAHLHARHRVRVALPRRGRPRLCQSLPLLLGRLQLPAGPRFSGRSHPRAGARGARARKAGRSRVDRAVRPSRDRAHPDGACRHGLFH